MVLAWFISLYVLNLDFADMSVILIERYSQCRFLLSIRYPWDFIGSWENKTAKRKPLAAKRKQADHMARPQRPDCFSEKPMYLHRFTPCWHRKQMYLLSLWRLCRSVNKLAK
jgi:hypothetical protein